jgi:uncharacterized membrane protein
MKKNPRIEYDLIITALLAFDCVAVILAGIDAAWVRTLAALLMLLLPGYALRSALFPKRLLDSGEQLLFSLASSVIVIILTGMAIYLVGWVMDASTWVTVLGVITLAACAVAGLRRRSPSEEVAPVTPLRLKWGQAVLVVLAVALALGALNLAGTPLNNPANIQGYTILWILPVGNNAQQYVHVGVISNQFTATDYRLQLMLNNKPIYVWPDIRLAPGQRWDALYTVPASTTGSSQVSAVLVRLDQPKSVYRQVNLQLGP